MICYIILQLHRCDWIPSVDGTDTVSEMQVLRYRLGEFYAAHNDNFDPEFYQTSVDSENKDAERSPFLDMSSAMCSVNRRVLPALRITLTKATETGS